MISIAKASDQTKVEEQLLQSATSVSIVFASQYSGNPASIMGHTFLKFNDPKIPENLLPTINYGADVPDDEGPIGYVFRGLFGGFEGQYGLESFFQKKKEYRDIENRHLWEYEFLLSPDELQSLKAQISAEFSAKKRPYYFLDQNCSFELIQQIEKVRKGPRFTDKTYFFVLPHETIRWLDTHGYLKPPRFFPSLRSQMLERYESTSRAEKNQILASWSSHATEKNMSAEQLDVLLFRLQMEEYRSGGTLPEKLKSFENEVLTKRAQLGRSQALPLAPPQDPLQSHRPHLLAVSASDDTLGVFLSPGIHHIFQDEAGFTPNTELSFLEFDWSLGGQFKQGSLDQFTVLNLSSWIEYSALDPKPSWRVRLFDQKEDYTSDEQRTQRLEASYGIGTQWHNVNLSFLLGPLLVSSNTPVIFSGSRLQWRMLASYQHRRSWRVSWTLFNSSEQMQESFVDSQRSQIHIVLLNVRSQLDLGFKNDFVNLNGKDSSQTTSVFTQLAF